MSALPESLPPAAANDADAQETREWLDALQAVIGTEGGDRAHFLLEQLIDQARQAGIDMPFSANSFQSCSAVMMTRSVRASMSDSLAPGRKTPGGSTPRAGWRAEIPRNWGLTRPPRALRCPASGAKWGIVGNASPLP